MDAAFAGLPQRRAAIAMDGDFEDAVLPLQPDVFEAVLVVLEPDHLMLRGY